MEHLDTSTIWRSVRAGLFKKQQRVIVNSENDERDGMTGTVVSRRDKTNNLNIVTVEDPDFPLIFLDTELEEPRKPCKRG